MHNEKKFWDHCYFEAYCYATGTQVKRNMQKAEKLYQEGIKAGSAKCYYGLAVIMQKRKENTEQIKNMYSKAFEPLLTEARNGDSESQRMISCYYLYGDRGVEQNTELAIEWLKRAADGGNAEAQYNLGIEYMKGTLIPQNTVNGLWWIEISSKAGHEKAKLYLEKLEYYN